MRQNKIQINKGSLNDPFLTSIVPIIIQHISIGHREKDWEGNKHCAPLRSKHMQRGLVGKQVVRKREDEYVCCFCASNVESQHREITEAFA